MQNLRILLAEDRPVMCQALEQLLCRHYDLEIVGILTNPCDFCDSVVAYAPDILLYHLHIDTQTSLQYLERVRLVLPQTRILCLSEDFHPNVMDLLSLGVEGYILMDDDTSDVIVMAIRKLSAGQRYYSPQILDLLVNSMHQDQNNQIKQLTEREFEVLCLMSQGYKNACISHELCIAEQTVKNHIRSILNKLDVSTRIDAVLYARDHNLVTHYQPRT